MMSTHYAVVLRTTIVCASLLGTSQVTHAENDPEHEGGIGFGYYSRVSAKVTSAEIAPVLEEGEAFGPGQEYESSTPIKLSYDLAGMFLPSTNGNLHGLETSISVTLFPFDFDWWGGTTVTMLSIGQGGAGSIRLRGGFGAGLSYNHAYAYLKSQLAAVIVPKSVSIEASVFWIPNQVSSAWGDRKGDFEELRTRGSAFIDLGKGSKKIEIYAEHTDRQRGGHAKDYMADREDFTTRDPTDDLLGLGIGASLMLDF